MSIPKIRQSVGYNVPMSRRFQFSLRALLVFLTLGCVWLAWRVEPAMRQREAVEAIRARGGQLFYVVKEAEATYEMSGKYISEEIETDDPPIGLIMANQTLSLDDMRTIGRLTSLELLDLCFSEVSEADLRELDGLINLRYLRLPRKTTLMAAARLRQVLPKCEVECEPPE